jgi:hypothetical protein
MSKARDEQIKLSANLLNAISVSCFTLGVVGPMIAVVLNLGDAQEKVPLKALILSTMSWSLGGAVLHSLARRILKGLDR